MTTENKKNIKFIIVFIIIVAFSFAYLFQASYAKYRKQIEGNLEMGIAKWNLKINNEDIRNKKILENNIIPEFEESEYTNANVLAPGSSGYCDIIIDATNVDVTFNLEFSAEIPEESAIKDLKITDYIINPSETNTTKIAYTEGNTITNTIQHNTETTKIRIFITWDDSDTATMDNIEDTKVATDETSKALVGIKLKLSQYNN